MVTPPPASPKYTPKPLAQPRRIEPTFFPSLSTTDQTPFPYSRAMQRTSFLLSEEPLECVEFFCSEWHLKSYLILVHCVTTLMSRRWRSHLAHPCPRLSTCLFFVTLTCPLTFLQSSKPPSTRPGHPPTLSLFQSTPTSTVRNFESMFCHRCPLDPSPPLLAGSTILKPESSPSPLSLSPYLMSLQFLCFSSSLWVSKLSRT